VCPGAKTKKSNVSSFPAVGVPVRLHEARGNAAAIGGAPQDGAEKGRGEKGRGGGVRDRTRRKGSGQKKSPLNEDRKPCTVHY